MFDRSKVLDVASELDFREFMGNSPLVGENARYHTGGPTDGHLMKRIAARHAMSGRLFLFTLRNQKDPKKWDYFARILSPEAGKILKMEPYK